YYVLRIAHSVALPSPTRGEGRIGRNTQHASRMTHYASRRVNLSECSTSAPRSKLSPAWFRQGMLGSLRRTERDATRRTIQGVGAHGENHGPRARRCRACHDAGWDVGLTFAPRVPRSEEHTS